MSSDRVSLSVGSEVTVSRRISRVGVVNDGHTVRTEVKVRRTASFLLLHTKDDNI